MLDRILISSPDVGQLEEEFVVRALRSGWIAPLGPDVDAFEAEVAARVGVENAIAMISGTAALHAVLVAWGVGRGDVVLTSTMTFAATANAIAYTGAEPFFVDSEPETGNIDPELLRHTLKEFDRRRQRVAAIIPVDLLGRPVDYSAIIEAASFRGIPVLADAAEALGSKYGDREVGAFGTAAAFSFNGNKVMTTSGGGMVVTDDRRLSDRIRYLAAQARMPARHYEHVEIGYNYRLSNLLAALGRAQLQRLDEMILKRHQLRLMYQALFCGVPGVRILGEADGSRDNAWLTAIVVDEAESGWSVSALVDHLDVDGIETRPLWKPMHLQPVFLAARGTINGTSQRLFETGITLPSGSALRGEEIDRVSQSVSGFLARRR